MRSKSPGQSGEVTRRTDGRALAGRSTAPGRTNESASESQRMAKLALLPLKLLRFTDMRDRTGLSRSTVWRLERTGAFPKHIKVSANIVAWLEQDVVEWIRSKTKRQVA